MKCRSLGKLFLTLSGLRRLGAVLHGAEFERIGQHPLLMRTRPSRAGAARRQRANLPDVPMARPLGELSPQVTERVFVFLSSFLLKPLAKTGRIE